MNNTPRRKPKLLIIGHARHGKDTFADLVVETIGLSFISSSEFVGRVAIWEQWGQERYCSFSEFFEDRINHRELWFNFIVAYNTPDLARTGKEMMAEHDVYVGMRNPDEFHACMDAELFDYVIWVDGSSRHPSEPKSSNGMTKDMADIWIDNNGPEENLQIAVDNLQKRLHDEGFDVNWTPLPNAITEEQTAHAVSLIALEEGLIENDLETDTEHFQLVVGDHPDPHDPPVQRPLVINSDRPTLKEYTGIINTPIVPDTNWEEVRCNGDCGCEDGSLCHENVCGPRSKMIVNPTLEESRKFHNDALMATCPTPLILPATPNTPNILRVGYQGEAAPAKPSTIPLIARPDSPNKPPLDWKDAPEDATKVLDHGFFKILSVMGTDQAIVDAARMSYGRGTKPVNSSASLINYLVRNYHTSPLEMCEIKFHIRMPIFVMRQWVRHRTANLNEYSGRYSEMIRLFYVPELTEIRSQDKVNKQGSAELLPLNEAELVRRSIRGIGDECFDEYETLLEMGVSRETARIVLPLNTYTEVVWKLDISNLIKFLRLRDDSHAQWEIRQYAILVSKAVEEHFPLVFAAYMEARLSETFTGAEMNALVNGDFSNLSRSQSVRMAALRDSII